MRGGAWDKETGDCEGRAATMSEGTSTVEEETSSESSTLSISAWLDWSQTHEAGRSHSLVFSHEDESTTECSVVQSGSDTATSRSGKSDREGSWDTASMLWRSSSTNSVLSKGRNGHPTIAVSDLTDV